MKLLKKNQAQFGEQIKKIINDETFPYIGKRLLQGMLTLLLASFLCFMIIKLTPGNYLDTLKNNQKISLERFEEIKKQFGLDQPPILQYLKWLIQVITKGNFGQSLAYSRPVTELILSRLQATLELAISSIFFTWLIAIPLGIIAAVNQNKFLDKFMRIISYITQGLPSLIMGIFLLILAQNIYPLFPVGDRTSVYYDQLSPISQFLDVLWHATLPTISLSVIGFGGLQRITRGQLLDVLRQDYIQTARAKGLPENKVIYVHALRNAINPLITLLGFEFASLLGGAFISETIFNWPGLGKLTIQATLSKDVYLVMASLMMGAVMLIIGNLFADVLLKFADPRIKLEDLK